VSVLYDPTINRQADPAASLTIANQMLSLVGSILSEPFSNEHVSSSQNVQNADAPATQQDVELREPEQTSPDRKERKRKKHAEGREHKRKKSEGKEHKPKMDSGKESKPSRR
jgi:hypothetical protein